MIKNILAIETSCDETSASVLQNEKVLSNIISSQLFHTQYGGIVPELASRTHIKIIDKIVIESLKEANIKLSEINIIAATAGPGLIGSLLVGLNYAKSISIAGNIHFSGINHIESHLYSPFIGKKEIKFPFLSLIVSGGHTLLVLVKNYFVHTLLGRTQDDAAGEAFDKGAKMLGLGYPGGPEIDKLSKTGNENFYDFPVTKVRENVYDFSFSGIKTSLLYYLRKNYPDLKNIPLSDVSASYQKAIVNSLIGKTLKAAKDMNVKIIAVSGGVSMNSKLRSELEKLRKQKYEIYFPASEYTTDNAAMIGFTAYLKNKYIRTENNELFTGAFAKLNYTVFNKLQ